MSTELATYQPGRLTEEMAYAKAVAAANMLPDNYRGKPADIMLAVGLGRSMGLSPAESLYRISVIKGKPTASAELIAANVRKAGHRLRVTGDETTATCTIIRADDQDYEFTVVRDLAWAQRMGLANNDNYKRQAGTMLQWRAITACARLACPEALYGVAYSSDEMADMPAAAPRAEHVTDRLAELTAEPVSAAAAEARIVEAEVVESPLPDAPAPTPTSATADLWARMKSIPKDQAKPFLVAAVGHDLEKATDITEDEAREVLDNFDALLADFMAGGA